MLLLVLLLQAASPVLPQPRADGFSQRAWGHFSRSPLLGHASEIVDVTIDYDRRTHASTYALRLTRKRFSQAGEVLWADSRTCPAVRRVLTSMQTLALPSITVPGLDRYPGNIVIDGVAYSLRAPALFVGRGGGQAVFTSNVGTPLATWVDRSLAALGPCWSALAPSDD